jgi:hypothetical protein
MTTHERNTMKLQKKITKVEARIAELDTYIADKSNPKDARKDAKAARREAHLTLEKLYEQAAETGADDSVIPPEFREAPDVPDEPSDASIAAEQGRRSNGGSVNAAAREATRAAAEKVMVTGGSEGAITKARDFAAAVEEGEATDASPEEIKERVKAKRATREEMVEEAKTIDRADGMKVAEYNERAAAVGGVTFLTSDREKAKADALVSGGIIASLGGMPTALVEHLIESTEPHVVEPLETEAGTEYVAGPARPDLVGADEPEEEDPIPRDKQHGRPLLFVPGSDKPQPHTRVTTFVGAIEDQEGITRWKGQRIVEGIGRNSEGTEDDIAMRAGEASREHDFAVAEAARRLAEDEVTLVEYRDLVEGAEAMLKRQLDAIREEAFVLGGGEKKADAGTRLHKLTEYVDRGEDLPDDVTASELADLDAYKRACEQAGLKVKAIELFVANAEHKTAGTLDRLFLYKPKGAQRAKTVVGDLKTGKVDYPGKIAGQIAEYAASEVVDLETIRDPEGTRSKLGAVQDVGLVIHLPAGRGECTIYEIDLAFGRRWNRYCAEVRSIRNESKRKGVVLKAVES